MSTSPSAVPFQSAVGRRRVDALEPATIHRSSREFGWDGIVAEIGSHSGWFVDDLVVDGYYLAINIDDKPLVIESRERGRFVKKHVPTGSMVVHPHGESFSFRVPDSARWAGVVLTPSLIRDACDGRLPNCMAQFGVTDPKLLSRVAFAVKQLNFGREGALAASDAAVAIAAALATTFVGAQPIVVGGLTQLQLRRVDDFIQAHIGDNISVADLANVAGLSVWHFARAFAAVSGVPPHQFVLRRRLALARNLLRAERTPMAEIAAACGFADHAHFTRSFRSNHGFTPTDFRRRYIR